MKCEICLSNPAQVAQQPVPSPSNSLHGNLPYGGHLEITRKFAQVSPKVYVQTLATLMTRNPLTNRNDKATPV